MISPRVLAAAWLVSAAPVAAAQNNGLPGPDQSVVLLETVSAKGLECGLLQAWQAAGLRAQVEAETRDWSTERRATAAATAAERIASTPRDDEFLNTYLDAVSENMRYEVLPQYLLSYHVLASMESPPAVFQATALQLEHSAMLEFIDANLSDIAGSGRPPEGGKPWPEFAETTETRVKSMVASYLGGAENSRYSADEAAALIAQTVLITRLWYNDKIASLEAAAP